MAPERETLDAWRVDRRIDPRDAPQAACVDGGQEASLPNGWGGPRTAGSDSAVDGQARPDQRGPWAGTS
jgi:hypothetical protein